MVKKMTKKELNKRSHFLYNKILKDIVVPMIGDKTTYLSQLDGAGKKLLNIKFKGVYPSDKIPKLNDLSPYCILNLDKSDEPGSHWISLCKVGDGCLIYDSFGRDYKKIIPQLKFSGNGKIYEADRSDKEQEIKETDCGARCIAFIVLFDKWGYKYAKSV